MIHQRCTLRFNFSLPPVVVSAGIFSALFMRRVVQGLRTHCRNGTARLWTARQSSYNMALARQSHREKNRRFEWKHVDSKVNLKWRWKKKPRPSPCTFVSEFYRKEKRRKQISKGEENVSLWQICNRCGKFYSSTLVSRTVMLVEKSVTLFYTFHLVI